MSIDSKTAQVERLLAMCDEAIGMERLERARANLNAERGRSRDRAVTDQLQRAE